MPYHSFCNYSKHVTSSIRQAQPAPSFKTLGNDRRLCRCRVPEECPAEIAQLYQACLSELPAQRPKAADLVRVIACADSAADAGVEGVGSAGLAGRKSLRWLSRQHRQ